MNWSEHFVVDPGVPNGLRWARNASNNRMKVGTPAGSYGEGRRSADGYYTVKVGYEIYRNHRIVWEMHNGPIPDGMFVDHIDGNTSNNHIDNLRVVTNQSNCYNQGKRTNNSSGVNGVNFSDNGCGKFYWSAQWNENGKRQKVNFAVDTYGDSEAKRMAVEARKAAEERIKQSGINITERHGK